MNPTPPNFLYIWKDLSLFTLEYGGRAIYMETHPKGEFRLGVGAQKWVGVQEIHSSHW